MALQKNSLGSATRQLFDAWLASRTRKDNWVFINVDSAGYVTMLHISLRFLGDHNGRIVVTCSAGNDEIFRYLGANLLMTTFTIGRGRCNLVL